MTTSSKNGVLLITESAHGLKVGSNVTISVAYNTFYQNATQTIKYTNPT